MAAALDTAFEGSRYQPITCPTCARPFTVRVARSHKGTPLPTPTVIVPWHRQRESPPMSDTTPDPTDADSGDAFTECPECTVSGADVYRADAHPISCAWMMRTARRCGDHDELLRPDEATCPAPTVDEDADDPHGRLR